MYDNEECDIYDNTIENSIWGGLRKLYFDNECFDVTLLAKDDEIPAHKVVLASASLYFKVFLASGLTSKNISSIDVGFCDGSILKLVLDFIYTGKITLNQQNVIPLIEAQDYLGIGVLHPHLSYYLLTTLNDNNCWQYFEYSDRKSYEDVFVVVERYIRTNFMKLICGSKSGFLNLSANALFSFFNSDFLGISDQECLLLSLCEWMATKPEERLVHMEKLLSNVDIARIPSWRGMQEKLSLYFPPDFKDAINEWARSVGERRNSIERKPPLKQGITEVILIIGGVVSDDIVSSSDAFIPPMIYFRILPASVDGKELTIIPRMIHKRYKPTAVSSKSSVYVLGGTQCEEEIHNRSIPCEVYRITENKWYPLPNLPCKDTEDVLISRRPVAAFVQGNLYAALPVPRPTFWKLTRNDSSWVELPSPRSYELYDLVGVNGSVYCIGRKDKNSLCFLLERYDSYSELWVQVSMFFWDSENTHFKGVCIDNYLCIGSCKQWLRYNPCSSELKKMKFDLTLGDVLPSLCTYKNKQVASLGHVPSLELASLSGTSEFYLPIRSSAALASIFIPMSKPEPY